MTVKLAEEKMIMVDDLFVTKPFLPPLSEVLPDLEEVWASAVLSNNGPYHQKFEAELAKYLGVDHVCLFANATLALVTALQAFRVQGEVITTPYSFVATAHSILWNKLTPVFVDVDTNTCNIDSRKIEAAITPRTQAILAVHCYGAPCEMESIQSIADRYGLKVIYDAAHAFGVKKVGENIFLAGDCSILSFHATKVFNTFEGGAIICKDLVTKKRIDYLKNFGFADEVTVVAPGINGKMSEFNAVLGLASLRYVDYILKRRSDIAKLYVAALDGILGLNLFEAQSGVELNNSYFPIFITPEFPITRDELYDSLRGESIYARRYFYPLISEFPMYRGLASAGADGLKNAYQISREVICLPIYPDMSDLDVKRVIDAVLKYV